jgi:hypothetical protein
MEIIKNRLMLVAALTALGIVLVVFGTHMSKFISGGYVASVNTEKYPTMSPSDETEALDVCNMLNEGGAVNSTPYFNNLKEDCIAVATLNESRCKNPYYCTQIAKLRKDPSICERLPKDESEGSESLGQHFEQILCYSEVARLINDPQICNRIVIDEDTNASDDTNPSLIGRIISATCRAYSANYSNLCEDIPEEGPGVSYRNVCLMDFAEEWGNTSLCDLVGDKGTEGDIPLCYLHVAIKNKDKNICNTDEIAGWSKWGGYKFDCLAVLDNPRWCEELDSGSQDAKDRASWCYYYSAQYRKEPKLCMKVSKPFDQECLIITALEIARGKKYGVTKNE